MSATNSSYYELKLVVPDELRNLYAEAAEKHNEAIASNKYFDAGFDLFCPKEEKVYGLGCEKIDHHVKGSMVFFGVPPPHDGIATGVPPTPTMQAHDGNKAEGTPVGYFMYPRSSTGTKTPLRLANSIGIIDSGYRGNYIAAFDNCRGDVFDVVRLQRLVQICPPNLTYPMKVYIVDDFGEAAKTARGEGGFGSSGL